jgi:hypothetical protein
LIPLHVFALKKAGRERRSSKCAVVIQRNSCSDSDSVSASIDLPDAFHLIAFHVFSLAADHQRDSTQ